MPMNKPRIRIHHVFEFLQIYSQYTLACRSNAIHFRHVANSGIYLTLCNNWLEKSQAEPAWFRQLKAPPEWSTKLRNSIAMNCHEGFSVSRITFWFTSLILWNQVWYVDTYVQHLWDNLSRVLAWALRNRLVALKISFPNLDSNIQDSKVDCMSMINRQLRLIWAKYEISTFRGGVVE